MDAWRDLAFPAGYTNSKNANGTSPKSVERDRPPLSMNSFLFRRALRGELRGQKTLKGLAESKKDAASRRERDRSKAASITQAKYRAA